MLPLLHMPLQRIPPRERLRTNRAQVDVDRLVRLRRASMALEVSLASEVLATFAPENALRDCDHG